MAFSFGSTPAAAPAAFGAPAAAPAGGLFGAPAAAPPPGLSLAHPSQLAAGSSALHPRRRPRAVCSARRPRPRPAALRRDARPGSGGGCLFGAKPAFGATPAPAGGYSGQPALGAPAPAGGLFGSTTTTGFGAPQQSQMPPGSLTAPTEPRPQGLGVDRAAFDLRAAIAEYTAQGQPNPDAKLATLCYDVAASQQAAQLLQRQRPASVPPERWAKFSLHNPDPDRCVPQPVVGFQALATRVERAQQALAKNEELARQVRAKAEVLLRAARLSDGVADELRARNATLQLRLLRVAKKAEVARRENIPVHPEERRLAARLRKLEHDALAPRGGARRAVAGGVARRAGGARAGAPGRGPGAPRGRARGAARGPRGCWTWRGSTPATWASWRSSARVGGAPALVARSGWRSERGPAAPPPVLFPARSRGFGRSATTSGVIATTFVLAAAHCQLPDPPFAGSLSRGRRDVGEPAARTSTSSP